MQTIFTLVSVTLIVLEQYLRLEVMRFEKMVATLMKDNRLSCQKIYRKSQNFFYSLRKSQFKFNPEICKA
jgi:hypothetical protein